ncbi:hypothetical protein VTJ83DRAFT_2887 [Remersonia thermophila]|uniref:Peptidase S8/S53 domain-containing protein n=1 Tax=Remersonia thermophila TaxID=72144 RepID=A0ABR4DDY2_9PEZI
MRISLLHAVVCGAISLWASVGARDLPRIALKLTPEAHERQQNDPNYIASLVQKARATYSVEALGIKDRRDVPGVSVRPLIQSPTSVRFARRAARSVPVRRRAAAGPNFDLWYQIQVDTHGVSARNSAEQNSTDAESPLLILPTETLNLIHALHRVEGIQSAHALRPGPPPAVHYQDDPLSANQSYLYAAPEGINAPYGWQFPGGDGSGVKVVDIERGWNFDHEDLAAANITLISGRNKAYFDHGTAVLGEMFMVDNQLGGIGIIPGAKGYAVSQHRPDLTYNTADAILEAAAHLSAGDIILIEAQEFDPKDGGYYWPVEITDANFDAILSATSQGIIVVQPACNGAYDLDRYTNLAGKKIFNRNTPDFRDSGAIMVGGASYQAPHGRWPSSNHGSRIDVYSWAEGVVTTATNSSGTDNTLYTSSFPGTSAASPVIVGAAGIIQGISIALRGTRYGPLEMRSILSNPAYGTSSANFVYDRIGTQPDLQLILNALFPDAHQTSSTLTTTSASLPTAASNLTPYPPVPTTEASQSLI